MPEIIPLQALPVAVGPRAVDPHWSCQRSGDCCTKPPEVTMTKEEAALLVHHAPKEIKMEFRPLQDNFVAMKAGPCPLFAFNTCLVYEVRPFNCRRFACMRPDPASEPFELDGGNLRERVRTSRVAARLYQTIQRRAQRWALKHGWKV